MSTFFPGLKIFAIEAEWVELLGVGNYIHDDTSVGIRTGHDAVAKVGALGLSGWQLSEKVDGLYPR